jgi:PTH1 family peptidyl-tRNA hydrolase
MIELVAFLGNPGPVYARNRHNAGWLLADRLPFASSLTWQKKYQGSYAALDSSRLQKVPGTKSESAEPPSASTSSSPKPS